MQSFFKELFEYNRHYNQKLIKLLSDNSGKVSEKSIQLMNHIINAHQIWNSRITGEAPFDVWVIHSFADLEKLDLSNYSNTLQILESKNIDEKIKYTNSRGETFVNISKDILFHVVNHSTYHRAQIATECKLNGISPLVSDYIFLKREQTQL
ncbi:MAG: DinB family protein [Bacteroidota bacterium]